MGPRKTTSARPRRQSPPTPAPVETMRVLERELPPPAGLHGVKPRLVRQLDDDEDAADSRRLRAYGEPAVAAAERRAARGRRRRKHEKQQEEQERRRPLPPGAALPCRPELAAAPASTTTTLLRRSGSAMEAVGSSLCLALPSGTLGRLLAPLVPRCLPPAGSTPLVSVFGRECLDGGLRGGGGARSRGGSTSRPVAGAGGPGWAVGTVSAGEECRVGRAQGRRRRR